MGAWMYTWLLVPVLFLSGSYGTEHVSPVKTDRHPFYISVTEVNHNAKDRILEISCKLFADDFEETLEKNYKAGLDITLEKDKSSFDRFIPDYMQKHLSLSVDGKPVRLSYLGFEEEKGSAYCYFEVTDIASVKKMDFTVSILHDFNKEQMNIIHATVNGNRKSERLNFPDTKAIFGW